MVSFFSRIDDLSAVCDLLAKVQDFTPFITASEFVWYQFLEESVIGEEVLDDIKDEDELQCDFEDLNEKPILNLNDVKVNLINEKTRYRLDRISRY